MRQHAIVLVDVEGDQSARRGDAVMSRCQHGDATISRAFTTERWNDAGEVDG
jgi:hypothetical protein